MIKLQKSGQICLFTVSIGMKVLQNEVNQESQGRQREDTSLARSTVGIALHKDIESVRPNNLLRSRFVGILSRSSVIGSITGHLHIRGGAATGGDQRDTARAKHGNW